MVLIILFNAQAGGEVMDQFCLRCLSRFSRQRDLGKGIERAFQSVDETIGTIVI